MIEKTVILCNAAFIVAAALATPAYSASPVAIDEALPEGQWRFRVLLDGKKIGFHEYDLEHDGDRLFVEARAEFDVKFLFINAYSYRHSLKATWQGRCLESLESQTDANGEKLSVVGERNNAGFEVESGETEMELPSCVMNFAYWDPKILEQDRLLNPQTGKYLDIEVRELGETEVMVDGQEVNADAYRITAKDMRIDLWYSQEDREWVALESQTKGDRIIRYERESYDA